MLLNHLFMPSARVTLISNTLQTKRKIVVIEDPLSQDVSSILSLAKQKLQMRKLKRIFVTGGREVLTDNDLQDIMASNWYLLSSVFVGCG